MPKCISLLLACWLVTAGVAHAQSLDQEMPALAANLTKALVAQGSKNVATIDFTDLQGQPTELGRFLSERLAVEMVLAGGVSMLDRANIKSILAEHKLTEEGLVNPANAKKLGEFAGVDAILIGNVTSLDARIVLIVKAVATESSKLVAAGRITFPKTSDIQQLLNRGISSTPTASTTSTAGSGTSYQDANAIATKDIGSLRVVLKSVLPMKLKGQNDQSTNGIRCSFEFINRETQRPLVVAANAEVGIAGGYYGKGAGGILRTTLVDDRGTLWKLYSSNVTGLGVVSVGIGADGHQVLHPEDIVRVLQLRDETGSDSYRQNNGSYGTTFIYPDGRTSGGGPGNTFVFGVTTPIMAGQSVTVVMNFFQDDNEAVLGSYPKLFQLVSEIVVGVVAIDTKKSYSLQNLILDRVSMPAF